MKISLVSPVYLAENIINKLVNQIEVTMVNLNVEYEIILVDDRSPDDSWIKILEIAKSNSKVIPVRLSRNFGQHAAIMAGLSKTQGEWVVVMDCDLQDQPKEIKKLYDEAMRGYDIVLASRANRQDTFIKKISSKCFYKIFNYLAGVEIDNSIANFGIYHRKVIRSVLNVNDYIKFFPLFINWVGYKKSIISIEHANREEGDSSYNWNKLFRLALDVIISFSDVPIRVFIKIGLSISVLSFCISIFYLIQFFRGKILEPGFTSLILSIWFISGITISCIGVVGIYLVKTFNQTKNRPVYIIDEYEAD